LLLSDHIISNLKALREFKSVQKHCLVNMNRMCWY